LTLKEALDALRIAFADFERAARSDDKTPLQNALALGEAKDAFATTDNSPSILVFADINRFKAVNNQYGYIAGDAAIGQVGLLIDEGVVKPDWGQAFRLSGDEFVVLLRKEFLSDFQQLTRDFSSCGVKFDNEVFIVSLSFGYALSEDGIEFEVLRERAELACKRAKTLGDGLCLGWTEDLGRSHFDSFRITCGTCSALISCEVPVAQKVENLGTCPACGSKL